eukprot:scaffold71223_cov36-Tisochrysis_lutea.AAC.3
MRGGPLQRARGGARDRIFYCNPSVGSTQIRPILSQFGQCLRELHGLIRVATTARPHEALRQQPGHCRLNIELYGHAEFAL